MLVQEEDRLKLQGATPASAHAVTQGANRRSRKLPKQGKQKAPPGHNANAQFKKKGLPGPPKCKFCRKPGHSLTNCEKRRAWFEKKGKPLGFVSFSESHMVIVPSTTWWIDTGANVHVSNSLQGFLSTTIVNPNEHYLSM